jgi:predicted RNase H-like nuclease (RuvC/YqgF family)
MNDSHELISRRPFIARSIDTSTETLGRLKTQIPENQVKLGELTTVADQLEEQAVIVRKEENSAIQTRTRQRSAEIRRLKGQIEDEKCLRDMLQRKIAEERRIERPNVPALCKNLESLKKEEKTPEESVRVLTAQDSCLKQVIAHKTCLSCHPELEKLQSEIDVHRSQITELKKAAKQRWTAEQILPGKLGAVAKSKIAELEALDRELAAAIEKTQQTKGSLQAHIAQLEKALVAHTPETCALKSLPTVPHRREGSRLHGQDR